MTSQLMTAAVIFIGSTATSQQRCHPIQTRIRKALLAPITTLRWLLLKVRQGIRPAAPRGRLLREARKRRGIEQKRHQREKDL